MSKIQPLQNKKILSLASCVQVMKVAIAEKIEFISNASLTNANWPTHH